MAHRPCAAQVHLGWPASGPPSRLWRAARRVDLSERWVPQDWRLLGIELALAPVGTRAVLLGRPGGPLFRPSEVLRLGHLAGITATVAETTTA